MSTASVTFVTVLAINVRTWRIIAENVAGKNREYVIGITTGSYQLLHLAPHQGPSSKHETNRTSQCLVIREYLRGAFENTLASGVRIIASTIVAVMMTAKRPNIRHRIILPFVKRLGLRGSTGLFSTRSYASRDEPMWLFCSSGDCSVATLGGVGVREAIELSGQQTNTHRPEPRLR